MYNQIFNLYGFFQVRKEPADCPVPPVEPAAAADVPLLPQLPETTQTRPPVADDVSMASLCDTDDLSSGGYLPSSSSSQCPDSPPKVPIP